MSVKDNSSQAAQAAPTDRADHRARRTHRVREKKAASKWLARRSDAPPPVESDAPPPFDETSGVTETEAPTPFVGVTTDSPEHVARTDTPTPFVGVASVDAALPAEELAARFEAPTVRPPSHPPVEEVREVPEAREEREEETKDEPAEAKGEVEEAEDTSREADTLPPMRPRLVVDEPIDERASGLPPKRQGRFLMMVIALCVIGGAVFGVRTLMHRKAKAPAVSAVVAPPPPEPKASPAPIPTEAPAPAPVVTGNAIEEREAARVLLEKRKAAEALPHAIRAVEIDPSDAQTWLILGAAHQDSGHGVDARDTFLACTKKATVGPIHECRALLSYNGPR